MDKISNTPIGSMDNAKQQEAAQAQRKGTNLINLSPSAGSRARAVKQFQPGLQSNALKELTQVDEAGLKPKIEMDTAVYQAMLAQFIDSF